MSDVAAHAHLVMLELYGEIGAKKYGENPSDGFLRLFSRLMPEQINRILSHCREFLDKGVPWPPELGILQGLANKPTECEIEQILKNIRNNKPASDIERYIASKCAYELRRATVEQQSLLVIKHYRAAAMTDARELRAMFNRKRISHKTELPFAEKRTGAEFERFVSDINKRIKIQNN